MFTGIIKFTSKIKNIKKTEKDMSFWIDLSKLDNFEIGDSIAVSGTCLTVAKKEDKKAMFQLMSETLDKTFFGSVKENDTVNIEDSVKMGDKLDGHMVYGDVDIVGTVIDLKNNGDSTTYTIEYPNEFSNYVVSKGRVTVDGISLTVNNARDNKFDISIIPHTSLVTNISKNQVNSRVNLEFDIYLKALFKRRNNE